MNCTISINPLADFSIASDAKRRSIIQNQKKPDTFKVSWYQLARARMKSTLAKKGDVTPILEGINQLKAKIPTKTRQINDRQVSLEAMERFLHMKLPNVLNGINYEVIKTESKSIKIKGVEVIVSPDIIIKAIIDDVTYVGAVKIHISKSNVFDNNQLRFIASTIYMYLDEVFDNEEYVVMPELCLAIDIFGSRIVNAPKIIDSEINNIEVICQEVKDVWSKV
jgi:hypothetical protein